MHIAALSFHQNIITLNPIVEKIFETVQLTTTAAVYVVESGHLLFLSPFRRFFDI